MQLIKRKIYAKKLKRFAFLYIGLPDTYDLTTKRYPVLYMQDGHNVFLKEDSFIGETWKMLELYQDNPDLREIIVVALDASNKENGRMYEYSPFKFHYPLNDTRLVGGGGDKYLDYLVNTIKPMIDTEFRTIKDRDDTAIMGSSLGGFIALYAGLVYPHIFGKIASLSGSFFVELKAMSHLISKSNLDDLKLIYLDTGDQETAGSQQKDYLDSNQSIYRSLLKKCGEDKVIYKVIKGGRHSEIDWSKRLKSVIEILYKKKVINI